MSLDVNQRKNAAHKKASLFSPLPLAKDSAVRFKSLLITKRTPNALSSEKMHAGAMLASKDKKGKPAADSNSEVNTHDSHQLHTEEGREIVSLVADARFIEQNIGVITQISAATKGEEEINKLMKQLASSFRAKRNESQFSVAHGVFAGARFDLVTNGNNLHVQVHNASASAQRLLRENQSLLVNRLRDHEITLTDLMFTL